MMASLWIALGGAVGSLGRFWLGEFLAHLGAVRFPWATLLVNVTGSFLIGLVATATGGDGRLLMAPELRAGLIVGALGGYTTFSSFSLQTFALAQDGRWLAAGANVLFSVLLCLLGVWLGHAAGLAVNRS
jgi:CrcB protein